MTTLNSRLQLALLNRKKGRNLLEKGFTLVELMIVIVIVGVLSATAIPQFLGLRDRAVAGSTIGSIAGFAKECATGQITLTPAQMTSTKLTNAKIDTTFDETTDSGTNCNGDGEVTFANASLFDASKIGGVLCGKTVDGEDVVADGATHNKCTLAVQADGSIVGLWSAETEPDPVV